MVHLPFEPRVRCLERQPQHRIGRAEIALFQRERIFGEATGRALLVRRRWLELRALGGDDLALDRGRERQRRDRESVVQRTRVSVSVEIGGLRVIKKKKERNKR